MENKNNDLDYKEIGIITSDFVKVSDQLKLTCSKIISNNFSKFPIIIMCRDEISIGTLLINNSELINKWKYYASYLELLTEKKIISDSKKFKNNYKNSSEFCCLLVIINNNSKIIYIPYPED